LAARISPEADPSPRQSGYGAAMTRLRATRQDAMIAAALAIPSLVQVLVAPIAPRAVGVVIALVSTVPIAFRRAHPFGAALTGVSAWWLETDGYILVGYAAAFLLFYSLGAHEPDRRKLLAACAFALIAGAVGVTRSDPLVYEYVGSLFIVVGPTLVGRIVRRQEEQAARLRELTHHLEVERERSAHTAVAEERARIARELHDVVAHGVSVIAIQADAAEAALDRDPDLARAPLQAIHSSAGEALADMRRLLGVLREDEDGNELAPQPGLAQLDALIDRARGAGVPISLIQSGEPRELPASLDLSAYRILQEALTNVRKHARGAAATIALDWAPDALELRISDRGPGANGSAPGDGHGLVGMRERVKVHGGELRTGSAPQGGFEVHARLPLP
jgi:signal transduction histidine kinase